MPIDIGNNQLNSVGANVLAYGNIVTDGLALYLDAGIANSYPGSGTTWTDLSANGYDQLLVNGPAFNTGNGGYISYDGTDDYSSRGMAGTFISNPELNGNIFSFGCWCYVTSGWYIISSGGQTSSAGVAFSYQNASPFVDFKGTSRECFINISSGDFPTGTWINWMFVSDNSTFKVYKNGVYLQQGSVINGGNSDVQTLLTLGVPNNATNAYLMNGRLASVMFYSKALSASEVLQNFNANRRRFNI